MIDVLGPEKRRRRTTQEKIAIVQQSFEPGMTVSLVARGWGVSLVSRCLRVSRAQLSMPNVFTGSCARMRCCLSEKPLYRHRNGHILAKWP
ncbi:transposase [Escherichia coli]|uniref:transposase n=1 Tax=Escherichia coli TaxID=562 RepID=UPI003F4C2E5D